MATTTNFGWETPDDTDLVKDGALAMRTLGNAIDASLVDLKGGTTGQVLSKTSNTDMDFTWVTSDDANAIQNAIVDAKGDLIAASAADTPARLAVGNNGETLVADSSTSTGLRWQAPKVQNGLYNSSFQVWQRGTSFASALTYNADRYFKGAASANTVTRQLTNDTTNLPFIQYCLRSQRNSGSTSTTALEIAQSLETADSIKYIGRTVTFSFYARRGANFSASTLDSYIFSGTGTDQSLLGSGYTGQATVASGFHTLTTTWQRFSITGTVGTTATEISIYFNAAMSGTAGANDFFEITGLQLEVGSVATPYTSMTGTLQGELAACQRYCINYPADGAYNRYGGGLNYSTTKCNANIPLPVEMRTTPSLTTTGTASNYAVNHGADTVTACSAVPAINGAGNSKKVASVDATVSSGLTAGAFGILLSNNNTTSYLLFTAEL